MPLPSIRSASGTWTFTGWGAQLTRARPRVVPLDPQPGDTVRCAAIDSAIADEQMVPTSLRADSDAHAWRIKDAQESAIGRLVSIADQFGGGWSKVLVVDAIVEVSALVGTNQWLVRTTWRLLP